MDVTPTGPYIELPPASEVEAHVVGRTYLLHTTGAEPVITAGNPPPIESLWGPCDPGVVY